MGVIYRKIECFERGIKKSGRRRRTIKEDIENVHTIFFEERISNILQKSSLLLYQKQLYKMQVSNPTSTFNDKTRSDDGSCDGSRHLSIRTSSSTGKTTLTKDTDTEKKDANGTSPTTTVPTTTVKVNHTEKSEKETNNRKRKASESLSKTANKDEKEENDEKAVDDSSMLLATMNDTFQDNNDNGNSSDDSEDGDITVAMSPLSSFDDGNETEPCNN